VLQLLLPSPPLLVCSAALCPPSWALLWQSFCPVLLCCCFALLDGAVREGFAYVTGLWQVHYLAHRPGNPGQEAIQSALGKFLILAQSKRSTAYIHAVLTEILRTEDATDSSNCQIHHIALGAMELLPCDPQTCVYSHWVRLPYACYNRCLAIHKYDCPMSLVCNQMRINSFDSPAPTVIQLLNNEADDSYMDY